MKKKALSGLVLSSLGLLVFGFISWFKTSLPDPVQAKNHSIQLRDSADRIRGVSFVAPPSPFKGNPFEDLISNNISWISVIPYAFTPPDDPVVRYDQVHWQWWGETKQGARATILMAHENRIKVMLKPQVYIPRGWTGSMDYQTDEEWEHWERDYQRYILDMATMAEETGVEIFCIGTEFSVSVKKRQPFWHELIRKVRTVYTGKITYSANWDHYRDTPFWDYLDYIGVSAYFPLSGDPTPEVDSLKTLWLPWLDQMKKYSDSLGKKLLFTEYGYLTVDGAAGKTWELEKKIRQLPLNQKVQANAYQALFETFWPESFWAGGFAWKWFPEGEGHEGYPEKDYTPQGKLALNVLSDWYSKP